MNDIKRLKELNIEILNGSRSTGNEIYVENNYIFFGNQSHLLYDIIKRDTIRGLYINKIKNFLLQLFNSPNIEIVCITGSLSYNFSSFKDDIDLLIITKPYKLWRTLLKLFILIRAWKIKGFKLNLCINYATNIGEFVSIIQNEEDLLILFDLLKAIPIKGYYEYYLILNSSNAIKKWFKFDFDKHSFFISNFYYNYNDIIIETLVFILLMMYLRIKKIIQNLFLIKQKKFINTFNIIIRLHNYHIESIRYNIIRKIFNSIKSK